MELRNYGELNLPSNDGHRHLLEIQNFINSNLFILFEEIKSEPRDILAKKLVQKVEEITDHINHYGYKLYRADYSGDINYENSEQIYCNKSLTIHFHGFSAQVTWERH